MLSFGRGRPVAELVDHRQNCRFLPSFFLGDRIVGRHAGSSEWVAHEAMILCGGRVVVNGLVGLLTDVCKTPPRMIFLPSIFLPVAFDLPGAGLRRVRSRERFTPTLRGGGECHGPGHCNLSVALR